MNLIQREKQFLVAGTVLVGFIIIYQVFAKPAISKVRTLKRVVSDKRQVLSELRAQSEQHKAILRKYEKIRQEIKSQPEERKILSFIERVQQDSGLMQKVVYMKPSTTAVNDVYEEVTIEVKLQGVTLDQLIQFILKIELLRLTGLNLGFRV